MARVGGDHALLNELVTLFREDARQQVLELKRALAEADAEAFARAAHCLKRMLATFSAHRACALCRKLEHLARGGDLAATGGTLEALEHELAVLEKELASQA